jgi:hypothetical protein
MAFYAVVENSIVTDTIVADTLKIAEDLTGKTCVIFTEENQAYVGLGYENGIFEQPPKENPQP